VVLLGDAAHPPVPYLGQGAQQGLEDAGTFALLLKELCVIGEDKLSWIRLDTVLKLYNQLRVPRTSEMLDRCKLWGQMQQKRAENKKYNQVKEEKIKRDVFYHETLLTMLPGVKHDYKEELIKALEAEPLLPIAEEEAIC
jgi:2-polyprenyl-6-methoxyphenol hydroxylase-like FAD-dependent oxidoreductase